MRGIDRNLERISMAISKGWSLNDVVSEGASAII